MTLKFPLSRVTVGKLHHQHAKKPEAFKGDQMRNKTFLLKLILVIFS